MLNRTFYYYDEIIKFDFGFDQISADKKPFKNIFVSYHIFGSKLFHIIFDEVD